MTDNNELRAKHRTTLRDRMGLDPSDDLLDYIEAALREREEYWKGREGDMFVTAHEYLDTANQQRQRADAAEAKLQRIIGELDGKEYVSTKLPGEAVTMGGLVEAWKRLPKAEARVKEQALMLNCGQEPCAAFEQNLGYCRNHVDSMWADMKDERDTLQARVAELEIESSKLKGALDMAANAIRRRGEARDTLAAKCVQMREVLDQIDQREEAHLLLGGFGLRIAAKLAFWKAADTQAERIYRLEQKVVGHMQDWLGSGTRMMDAGAIADALRELEEAKKEMN